MSFKCKECGEEFSAQKSLHAHLKAHDMYLGDYYVKHLQRRNKLTGELIPFKNLEDYLKRDFSNRKEMIEWCDTAPKEEVTGYILDLLKNRVEKKNLTYGPTSIELYASKLPAIDVYKKFFGSYTQACELCGVKPLLSKPLPKIFGNDYSDSEILIDTREKQPLKFKNSKVLKLDVGDYAVGGDLYDYTYVDRKSFGDFCSTVTVERSRFAKELWRCKEMGGYLFIVVEENLYDMGKINSRSPKRYNLDFVFHQMKELQLEFKDCCQFVFSGGREQSEKLIPKLLIAGKKCWGVDIQYFIDKGENYGLD